MYLTRPDRPNLALFLANLGYKSDTRLLLSFILYLSSLVVPGLYLTAWGHIEWHRCWPCLRHGFYPQTPGLKSLFVYLHFFFFKYVSHPKHLSSLYSSLGEQGFPGCHPPKLTLGSIWYQVRIRIRIRIRITITIIFISGLGSVWYEANSLKKIHLTTNLKQTLFGYTPFKNTLFKDNTVWDSESVTISSRKIPLDL